MTFTRTVTLAAGVFASDHLGELTWQVSFELADAVLCLLPARLGRGERTFVLFARFKGPCRSCSAASCSRPVSPALADDGQDREPLAIGAPRPGRFGPPDLAADSAACCGRFHVLLVSGWIRVSRRGRAVMDVMAPRSR
jgi:hypothetical protein